MEINRVSNQDFGRIGLTKQAQQIVDASLLHPKTNAELTNLLDNLNYLTCNHKDAYIHAINLPNDKVHMQLSSSSNRFLALLDYNLIEYKPIAFIADKNKKNGAKIIDSLVKILKHQAKKIK